MKVTKNKIPPRFLVTAFSQVFLEELSKFDMPTLVKMATPLVPDLTYKIVCRAIILQLKSRFSPMLEKFDKEKGVKV